MKSGFIFMGHSVGYIRNIYRGQERCHTGRQGTRPILGVCKVKVARSRDRRFRSKVTSSRLRSSRNMPRCRVHSSVTTPVIIRRRFMAPRASRVLGVSGRRTPSTTGRLSVPDGVMRGNYTDHTRRATHTHTTHHRHTPLTDPRVTYRQFCRQLMRHRFG